MKNTIRVKIRVKNPDLGLIPGENKSYPGGARSALERMGATNFSVSYADAMPIYCDVSQELHDELMQADWIESVEVVKGSD